MNDTEMLAIESIADNILVKIMVNSQHVVYCIRVAEKLLRPHQLKVVKDLVIKSLRKQNI